MNSNEKISQTFLDDEELQDWKEKMSEPIKFKRITEEEYKQLKEAGKLN